MTDEHVHMWSGNAANAYCVGCLKSRFERNISRRLRTISEYPKKPTLPIDIVLNEAADEIDRLAAALQRIASEEWDGTHDLDTVQRAIAQQALGLPMCLVSIPDPVHEPGVKAP